mgnify:CR=1 FL=1
MARNHSVDMTPSKADVYRTFRGIDRSRDRAAMDTGKEQHLYALENAFCDWRGRIVKEPDTHRRKGSDDNDKVQTMKFYSREGLCWSQKDGGGVTLKSDRGHIYSSAFTNNSIASMTLFLGKVYVFSAGQDMKTYDGTEWADGGASIQPAFGTALQNRLVVSGIPKAPTEVHISRVRNGNVFEKEEELNSTSVTKAVTIDVRNLIGAAEEINGIGMFETNRLAVFTHDRCLVYKIDENLNNITIDENANIHVGCVSHRTITAANNSLLFCSRYGIHSVTRSDANGIYMTANVLSSKVEDLYRELVKSVENHDEINAVFDPDEDQYHIFFPQYGGASARRLTITMRGKEELFTWSEGTHLKAQCGEFLAGQLVYGSNGGAHNVLLRAITYKGLQDTSVKDASGDMDLWLPIIWHGSTTETKESRAVVIQASGSGTLEVSLYDDGSQLLEEFTVEIDDSGSDDNNFSDNILFRQYEMPFFARYRGLQIRIQSSSTGPLEIMAIAIDLKKES